MYDQSFDSLTRHAAGGISRRLSLVTLGAAGLAALASPFTLEAKKKGGKKKKKKQQSAPPPPDLCAPQLEPCKAFFTRVCGGDDPRCQAAIACCSHLGTCDADGYWACLVIASNS